MQSYRIAARNVLEHAGRDVQPCNRVPSQYASYGQTRHAHDRFGFAQGRVRDISYEGARIILSGFTDIPDVVELYIPEKKKVMPASVRWRHGNQIGVAFSEVVWRSWRSAG